MSWSVQCIGRPEAVVRALEKQAGQYGDPATSQSRREYDEALPHLVALVRQVQGADVAVKLVASGHASFAGSERTSGHLSVALDPAYGFVE